MWEKLGGRKFVAWVSTFIMWIVCIVWSYKIKNWSFLTTFTYNFFVLTGVYLGVNVWQKKVTNGGG